MFKYAIIYKSMKSTLTVLSALVLLIVAACIAFPKMSEPRKTPIKTSKLEVKTTSRERIKKTNNPNPIDIEFGLTASFGPKPEN